MGQSSPHCAILRVSNSVPEPEALLPRPECAPLPPERRPSYWLSRGSCVTQARDLFSRLAKIVPAEVLLRHETGGHFRGLSHECLHSHAPPEFRVLPQNFKPRLQRSFFPMIVSLVCD